MSLVERVKKYRMNENQVGQDAIRQSEPTSDMNKFRKIKEISLKRIVDELADQFDKIGNSDTASSQIRSGVLEIVNDVLVEEGEFTSRTEKNRIVDEILYEITGFGPIDPLIKDATISEIMINGPEKVYIERHGIIEKTDITFRSKEHILQVIEKIISPLGRRVDETSPIVDARLPDGSRVNAVIPPLATKGPTITIRKFAREPYNIDNLIGFGTLNYEMAEFLKACIRARLNIIIAGGTGSGKTTTLNVLSSFIPEGERIITIEDTAELQLHQEHVVSLESKPPNIEGKGRVTIRDLVINSLRMRPDRIVVGEVRGGEALDMLQAMNTGHDGSLTTAHANSPRDTLSRVETMALMAGMDLPIRAIREQIASAINLIIYQNRFQDGTRRITQITEITGTEGDIISLQDIFVYQQAGIDDNNRTAGKFKYTGITPRAASIFKSRGVNVMPGTFAYKQTD